MTTCLFVGIKKTTTRIEGARENRLLGQRNLYHQSRAEEQLEAPFLHGVASGDPSEDGISIWTRVTPIDEKQQPLNQTLLTVSWQMSTDMDFDNLVAQGSANTNADRDYTVQVDISDLQPYSYYYYKFRFCFPISERCVNSIVGRTKTAPSKDSDTQQLRFATVSCARYTEGYFHAYDRITDRNDVDAILHLGDYIYEDNGKNLVAARQHDPPYDPVTLDDYRRRYSQYRLDPALRRLHQLYPFITTWDDHDFANNAYRDGAKNHRPDIQGNWTERRQAAAQVYREWIPFRTQEEVNSEDNMDDNDNTSSTYNLYRRVAYGNLVDLFVLDTRIAARDKQKGSVAPIFLPDYYDKDQYMLGDTQMEWLKQQLVASTAQWKVVVQSVLVAPLTLAGTLALNMDAWDGYHADRAELLKSIADNQIDNVVFLSGDLHATVITDIPKETTVDVTSWTDWCFQKAFYLVDESKSYKSIAIEFLVTSVSAVSRATSLVDWLPNFLLPLGEWLLNGVAKTASGIWWSIPHFQFIDLQNLGYQIVDFQSHRVQMDVYFTGSVIEEIDKHPTQAEQYQISFFEL